MIENKEIGLKIAETEEEQFWVEIKTNTEEDIKRLEKLLKFQKAILEMSETNLKNFQSA
jgi:hypothetical protein